MYFLQNLWRISLPLVVSFSLGSHTLAQLEPPELAKEETIKSTDLSTDVPQGIENIGRDMIVLVDQIIFLVSRILQRLDIEPLLQDIFTAIDISPIINKAEVAVSQSLLNIEQIDNSRNFTINAGGGVNYSITQNSNGSSNQGGSLNPNITANKRVYDFGVLDLKEQEKIRLKITEGILRSK